MKKDQKAAQTKAAAKTNGTNTNTEVSAQTNVTETGNKTENEAPAASETPAAPVATTTAPAAAPAAPAITVAKKQPPLKEGKRGGGVGRKRNTNVLKFAEASYNDITNFARHIVNGLYIPMFNGMEGMPVDATKPVFKSAQEAFDNKAEIEFGIMEGKHEITYLKNKDLPAELKTSSPEKEYDCFIVADTKEQAEKAIERIKAFYAMPWNANTKQMVKLLPEISRVFPAPAAAPAASEATETEKATA